MVTTSIRIAKLREREFFSVFQEIHDDFPDWWAYVYEEPETSFFFCRVWKIRAKNADCLDKLMKELERRIQSDG